MANGLKMTMVEAIQSRRSAGLSCREIARRLGIDRGTVSRRLRVAGEPVSKPANAPIFPAGTEPALERRWSHAVMIADLLQLNTFPFDAAVPATVADAP